MHISGWHSVACIKMVPGREKCAKNLLFVTFGPDTSVAVWNADERVVGWASRATYIFLPPEAAHRG